MKLQQVSEQMHSSPDFVIHLTNLRDNWLAVLYDGQFYGERAVAPNPARALEALGGLVEKTLSARDEANPNASICELLFEARHSIKRGDTDKGLELILESIEAIEEKLGDGK